MDYIGQVNLKMLCSFLAHVSFWQVVLLLFRLYYLLDGVCNKEAKKESRRENFYFVLTHLLRYSCNPFQIKAHYCHLNWFYQIVFVRSSEIMLLFLLSGEGLLVTAGVVIYFGDMLFYTASKVSFMFLIIFRIVKFFCLQLSFTKQILEYSASSKLVLVDFGIKRDEIRIIIQVMVFVFQQVTILCFNK